MDNKVQEILDECRSEIDDIDTHLITCLARRFELSKTIGQLKRHAQVLVYQPNRAKEVQERYASLGKTQGLQHRFIDDLFHLIHEESCRVQCTED